jgi:hypothetical protein
MLYRNHLQIIYTTTIDHIFLFVHQAVYSMLVREMFVELLTFYFPARLENDNFNSYSKKYKFFETHY